MKNSGITFCVIIFIVLLFTMFSSDPSKTFIKNNLDNTVHWIDKSKINPIKKNNFEEFISHGTWIFGSKHHQTCQFINQEKCCKSNPKLHFEFHEKQLNRIDAVEELKKILKNKKLLLVGDSMMFEFFVGLKELLQVKTKVNMTKYFCENTSCSIHPGNNSTVTFIKACMIVLKGWKRIPETKNSRLISEEIIRQEIADHDIVFINQGLHYSKRLMLNDSTIYFNNIGKMLNGRNFT